MSLFKDLFRRLRLGWRWVAAQFVVTALLLLAGLAWTRLPDKHGWQVALSLLVPILLAISALELQAGTVRSFSNDDGKRVKMVWGAVTLLVWIALGATCWAVLDWCDDQIPQWAGYLNSQASAHARATLFTYEHIQHWLSLAEWILRWVIVPAKIIPYAAVSAQWGWRLSWMRVIRMLWNWRWWLGVVFAALLAVELPSRFFAAEPSGSVHAQIWHVVLKLIATYLLAVGSWVMLLGWVAVLFERIPGTVRSREAEMFCRNLRVGWRWIAAAAGVILAVNLPLWPLTAPSGANLVARIAIGIRIFAFAAVFVLLVLLFRSFLANAAKRTKVYWGILASLAWFGVTFAVASQDDRFPLPLLHWKWGDFVTFVLFAPLVASAAVWGWILPWKRIAALFTNPRWLAAGIATFIGETYLASFITKQLVNSSQPDGSPSGIYDFLAMSLSLGFVVLQLAWLAALLGESPIPIEANIAEANAPVPKATENNSPEEPLP
ncbi:MAG: hypothetical protein ABR912_02340 [Terracidiphilus sp.]